MKAVSVTLAALMSVSQGIVKLCDYDPPRFPTKPNSIAWINPMDMSCIGRINYYRHKACAEGWDECPEEGLPPMSECPCCIPCANSESNDDQKNGAHSTFTRCGEYSQGQGGGNTCGDVIDMFISERKKNEETGKMECTGHCGPVLRAGCNTFHWGVSDDGQFWTLNWKGNCNVDKCMDYCDDNSCPMDRSIDGFVSQAKCATFRAVAPEEDPKPDSPDLEEDPAPPPVIPDSPESEEDPAPPPKTAAASRAAAAAGPFSFGEHRTLPTMLAAGALIMAVLVFAFSFVRAPSKQSTIAATTAAQQYGGVV